MNKKVFFFIVLFFILSFAVNVFAFSTVSDINGLAQYITSNMQNHVSPISVNYTNPSDINSAVRNNILSGVYIKDDYAAVSYSSITLRIKSDSTNPSTLDIIITPTYVETAEQEEYVDQQVSQIISSVLQSDMTNYQKVAVLHDWVVSHVKYDTSLQDVSDYTALADGKTVCRGYSMLLYKLLEKAGFNSHIVLGEVISGFRYRHSVTGHAWNMVQLDGNWYYIDSTNDGLSTDNTTKFFLVSGKVMQQNGFKWDQGKYPTAPNSYRSTTPTVSITRIRITGLAFSTKPVTLSTLAIYSDGTKKVIPNQQASWTSSNTDVATVDSNGVVNFTGNPGKVTITAAIGNMSASVSTNVYYVLGMTRIKYTTATQVIQMYKVYPNGINVPVTGVIWASSDTSIASIDNSGNLIFTGANGVVTLSGTYNGQTISEQVVAGNMSNKTIRKRYSPYQQNVYNISLIQTAIKCFC